MSPNQSTAVDVVFLLPGFLGFEQFREYAYFGDRFGTALRASLAPRVTTQIQVVAVPLPPTGALAERQRALAKALVNRAKAIGTKQGVADIRGIHLVGHSTGGVDAQLLTLERSLDGSPWNDFDGVDVTWLRERIRSVISLASPHQGTCLVEDPLAKLIGLDSPTTFLLRAAETVKEGFGAAGQILKALPELSRDPELHTLLSNVFGSRIAWSFLRDIFRSRALIGDLSPAAAVSRYPSLGSALPVLRRSFVTIAGVTPSAQQSAVESAARRPSPPAQPPYELKSAPPDALFLLLAQLTSGRATKCFAGGPLLPGSLAALQAAREDPARIIAEDAGLMPAVLDAAVNDGVVNSVRQLINPSDPNELVALVVADHYDVVGHYDRALFMTDPKTGAMRIDDQVSGLLHSGSGFRDDQFFDLIEHMADAMLPALG